MEKKFTAENGTELFYYPNCSTHSFCLSLYIRAGVLYETGEENGITHFLEHIVFRNINHIMGGAMYRELDRRGLYFNGATYKEFVQLYIIGAPRHFREACDILLKCFEPLALPAEEVRTEQQRVKAEIRETDEFKTLDYFSGTHVWDGTSLERTITGRRSNISSFSRKKMEEYRRKVMASDNIFFYVTGNVQDSDMAYLTAGTGRPGIHETKLCRNNTSAVPQDFGRRNLKIGIKNSRDTVVQFSYDFVTTKYSYEEITILYDILFSGENSLIHQELSEKRGFIYSYSPVLEKYSNIGRIYFSYEVEPKELYRSVEIVRDGFKRLGENMEERIRMVLPEYTDNALILYDDNEDFNWNRAYENHIMNGVSRSLEETVNNFKNVKACRIKKMAEEIFTTDNLVFTMKGSIKKTDKEKIRSILLG